jgi:hypothetical protein
MKISTFTSICNRLNALKNVSKCDIFMTKEHTDRIIISFCLNPNLLGSIVIREQLEMESYELVIDRQRLVLLQIESAESDLGIPEQLIKQIQAWNPPKNRQIPTFRHSRLSHTD